MTSKIRGAIKILDKRGWVQGQSETKTGEVCGMAALALAHGIWHNGVQNGEVDTGPFFADKAKLDKYVRGLGFNVFTAFNDAPNTTKEKIIEVLEAVA